MNSKTQQKIYENTLFLKQELQSFKGFASWLAKRVS